MKGLVDKKTSQLLSGLRTLF